MQEPHETEDRAASERAAANLVEAIKIMPADRCAYCGEPADLVCDDCDRAADEKNAKIIASLAAEKESRRTAWFKEQIPDNYREPDDLLTPRWAREMEAAWNVQDRYGVTFQGPSQTHKTRTGIRLLGKAYLAGVKFEFHQAGELRREFNRLARDGKDAEFLKELCAVPVLMIDDLGNQAFTEASEEFFLALLEGRSNRRLKTIVTTQFPSDEFIAKTSNRRIGIAIARRIGPEFNWIVNTAPNPASINPPTPPQAR